MDMERRKFISAVVAARLGALSGCLGNPESKIAGTPEFTTTPARCGDGEAEYSVKRLKDKEELRITGVIGGSDTCATAELTDYSYDAEAAEFEAIITSKTRDGEMACLDCIVDIDYVLSVSFNGPLPETVTIYSET